MRYEINPEILKMAINKFGVEPQIDMIIEECLELALALQRLKRKRGNPEDKEFAVIDEIADVTIMLEQAKIIFSQERINDRVRFKMERLCKRIEEGVM